MSGRAAHRWISFYDIQGLIIGILFGCLAVILLKAAGLVTGQTVGIALLLTYVTSLSFGLLFFLITLPFVILAGIKRGWVFGMRTGFATASMSVLVPMISPFIVFKTIHPLVAAVFGGLCAALAVIALFRHNASAGGVTAFALVIEQMTGIKTGWTQLIFDTIIFAVSSLVLPFDLLAYSFVAAVIMNLVVLWNFRITQTSQPQ